jgi:hypothetical protein
MTPSFRPTPTPRAERDGWPLVCRSCGFVLFDCGCEVSDG